MKVLRVLLYFFLVLCLNGCSLLVLLNRVARDAPILPAAWEWEVKRTLAHGFLPLGFWLLLVVFISFLLANVLMERGDMRAGLALLTVPSIWALLIFYSMASNFLLRQFFIEPCSEIGERILQSHRHYQAPVDPCIPRPESVGVWPQAWPRELNDQFGAEFRKLNLQEVIVRDSAVYFIRYRDSYYSEVYAYAPIRSSSFMHQHGHRLDRLPSWGSMYDLGAESIKDGD